MLVARNKLFSAPRDKKLGCVQKMDVTRPPLGYNSSSHTTHAVVALVVLVGVGAVLYFKFFKGKSSSSNGGTSQGSGGGGVLQTDGTSPSTLNFTKLKRVGSQNVKFVAADDSYLYASSSSGIVYRMDIPSC